LFDTNVYQETVRQKTTLVVILPRNAHRIRKGEVDSGSRFPTEDKPWLHVK